MRQFRIQLRVEPGRGRLRNLLVGLVCLAALPALMLIGVTFWLAALVLAAVLVLGLGCVAFVRRLVSGRGAPRR